VSEREVAARIDSALMRSGTEQMGYFTIVGSGPKTVASCFLPTARAMVQGDFVQLDCAPMLDGYKGDFSRLALAGQSSARARRLVETVAGLYERCVSMLRPGVTCAEVAHAGLAFVEANGYSRENLFASANYPGGETGFIAGCCRLERCIVYPKEDPCNQSGVLCAVGCRLSPPRFPSSSSRSRS
jgi:Xaa-Pro aminopeptidase